MNPALAYNPSDFLHSLAKWLVGRAATFSPAATLVYMPGSSRSLWRNKVSEDFATDPYTVLCDYPGGPLTYGDRKPRMALQVMTVGTDDDAARAQCQTAYTAFTDADGHPMRMVTIPGFAAATDGAAGHWLIVSADPRQRPGLIGRDERGRGKIVFNVDLAFAPEA